MKLKTRPSKMDVKEFEIPVPWGHIAVKTWGNQDNTPVLAIHGVGDNAGIFDRLLPFLPTSFYYICIDLPSNGKSSHYPSHLVSIFDNISTLKLVVDYFKRKEYILMGHSWGGQAAIFFTHLYPEHTIKLIVLEAFHLFPLPIGDFKSNLTQKIGYWIKSSKNIAQDKQPYYTYHEALTKLIDGRIFGKINVESAEALIKRSLIPVGGEKFIFSNDPRLRSFVNVMLDMKFIENLVKKHPITCPLLIVYASDSEWLQQYNYKKVVAKLRKNGQCVIKKVTGGHYVHSNNPEIVGPIVNDFLLDLKSKL